MVPVIRTSLLLLAGCFGIFGGGGEADSEKADEVSGDTGGETGTASDPCTGVPALTWDNFGHGFLLPHCDGCHAATAEDRHDAPAEVTFDTPAEAWALAERILLKATGESPEMPPNGGVDADERTKLGWWLECGVPGT
jgi:hypothetical protein